MKSNEIKLCFPALVYGIGNDSRQDDGLGRRFIESVQAVAFSNKMNFLYQNQLCIEDALLIRSYKTVIFVDASCVCDSPFTFQPVFSEKSPFLYSHSVSVPSLLNICQELYQYSPEAYLLAIRGESWDFVSELSPKAEEALQEALHFFQTIPLIFTEDRV